MWSVAPFPSHTEEGSCGAIGKASGVKISPQLGLSVSQYKLWGAQWLTPLSSPFFTKSGLRWLLQSGEDRGG